MVHCNVLAEEGYRGTELFFVLGLGIPEVKITLVSFQNNPWREESGEEGSFMTEIIL